MSFFLVDLCLLVPCHWISFPFLTPLLCPSVLNSLLSVTPFLYESLSERSITNKKKGMRRDWPTVVLGSRGLASEWVAGPWSSVASSNANKGRGPRERRPKEQKTKEPHNPTLLSLGSLCPRSFSLSSLPSSVRERDPQRSRIHFVALGSRWRTRVRGQRTERWKNGGWR